MLLAGFFVFGFATAVAAQEARNYRIDAALDVDTQGRVIGVTPPSDLPPMLANPLRDAARHWHFAPVMKDGRPVTARTYGRVMLRLVPQSPGSYGVKVSYLSNGPSLTFTQAPRFPAAMMRSRTEGTVSMEAVVQPDGSITSMRLVDARISERRTGSAGHATRAFELAARDAMAHLQAKPEWIDGKPVPTRFSLPFMFSLNGVSGSDTASGSAVGAASGTAD